jgi:hypothetical protein
MIELREYATHDLDAVVAFNQRLSTGSIKYQFPVDSHYGSANDTALNNCDNIYKKRYLAVDGIAVRGGYNLKCQTYLLNGIVRPCSFYQLPLSEGLIDKKYNMLGLSLLLDALKRQPFLFGLGIGGKQEALARIVAVLGWKVITVPFYFTIIRPSRVFKYMSYLRRSFKMRFICDVLRYSGLGVLGILLVKLYAKMRGYNSIIKDTTYEVVNVFDEWADLIWEKSVGNYSFIAKRSKHVLNQLYPPDNKRIIRLRISNKNATVGWGALLLTKMQKDKYFGDCVVGSLVDYFSIPGREALVVSVCTQYLRMAKADLVVSNQSAEKWGMGFLESGYFKGPSNFLFAPAPAITNEINKTDPHFKNVFLTRGDGDGPLGL